MFRWQQRLDELNNVPDLIAGLDAIGGIRYTNRAWEAFAVSNGYQGPPFRDINYLDLCETAAAAAGEAGAAIMHEMIMDVLCGLTPERKLKQPCHAPSERRWFTAELESGDNADDALQVLLRFRNTTIDHLARRSARLYGLCSFCKLELPLLRPEPDEVAVSWACAYCDNRVLGVFDDLADECSRRNVLRCD